MQAVQNIHRIYRFHKCSLLEHDTKNCSLHLQCTTVLHSFHYKYKVLQYWSTTSTCCTFPNFPPWHTSCHGVQTSNDKAWPTFGTLSITLHRPTQGSGSQVLVYWWHRRSTAKAARNEGLERTSASNKDSNAPLLRTNASNRTLRTHLCSPLDRTNAPRQSTQSNALIFDPTALKILRYSVTSLHRSETAEDTGGDWSS
jgi:hypothetical protein